MSFSTPLRRWFADRPPVPRRCPRRYPVALEYLEDRVVPSGVTELVKDIFPGEFGGIRSGLINVKGTLFFQGSDGYNEGAHGEELWKTDGTTAGTVLVKDIRPGPTGSGPANLTDVNGTLFFTASDGVRRRRAGTSGSPRRSIRAASMIEALAGDRASSSSEREAVITTCSLSTGNASIKNPSC